jgi:hypothetical protein
VREVSGRYGKNRTKPHSLPAYLTKAKERRCGDGWRSVAARALARKPAASAGPLRSVKEIAGEGARRDILAPVVRVFDDQSQASGVKTPLLLGHGGAEAAVGVVAVQAVVSERDRAGPVAVSYAGGVSGDHAVPNAGRAE